MTSAPTSAPTERDPWMLTPPSTAGDVRVRLFCFAHAGAGASTYVPWRRAAPAGVDVIPVQLPGRENRFVEPGLTSVDAVVDAFVPRLLRVADKPFAFFGHSYGALIAWSITRRLLARSDPAPGHLLVSAYRAPHLPRRAMSLRGLSDAAFLEGLRSVTGAGTSQLPEDPDLLPLVLPALRADFTAIESCTPGEPVALPVPITALRGDVDPMVNDEEIAAWALYTTREFTKLDVPGDHFYVRSAPKPGMIAAFAAAERVVAAIP